MFLRIIILSLIFLVPIFASGSDFFSVEDIESAETGGEKRKHEGKGKEKSEVVGNKWFVTSGTVGFLSNYVFRGQTQTFGGPAVQGELVFRQREEDGAYVGIFGSNVDSTTATNGSDVELDLATGYIYKPMKDLTLKLELLYTWYPGAYAVRETKDSFNVFEIYPSITYKYFTLLWAYSFTNVRGINQNFVQDFSPPLNPNGSTKGSWYVEANMKLPIPGTEDKLKFLLSAGYQRVRNYNVLSYAVFGTGLSYTLPENWAGLILSVNASATTARKKYYTVLNQSGQPKNLVAPKLWVAIQKEF